MNKNKKFTKELADIVVEAATPYITARMADIKEEKEKLLFVYFNEVEPLKNSRVRDVRIEDSLFIKKVIVDYSNEQGEFFSKSYSYDRVMEKIKDKKIREADLYGRVVDNYFRAFQEIKRMAQCGEITWNNRYIFDNFFEYYEELGLFAERKFLLEEDLLKIEELGTKLKVLASEAGFELEDSENLYEKSLRDILEKDAISLSEKKFLLAAIDYLDDEVEGMTFDTKKFSKLSYNQKIRLTYHKILHDKVVGYQLCLVKKHNEGRMVNKLFTENKQARNRRDKEVIEKVLTDEELTSDDYTNLTWMNCDYADVSIDTLSRRYVLSEIREKVQVYKKLLATESRYNEVFERKIRIITDWEHLITILCGDREHIKDDLDEYADELFEREITFVDMYAEGYKEEFYTFERKNDLQRIQVIFEKMLECFDSIDDKNSMTREKLERYLDVTNRNLCLFNITKDFRYFMDNDRKTTLYDFIDGVSAYYDSFSESARAKELSISNNKLRDIVNFQREVFEEDLSLDLIKTIKEGSLEVPKRYFKQ